MNKWKLAVCLLALLLTLSLTACGGRDAARDAQTAGQPESSRLSETAAGEESGARETVAAKAETAANETAETGEGVAAGSEASQGGSRILIAYFTAAENCGVDAVASASYTTINGEAVGRVRAVAERIQENTEGDLFAIRTSFVYPADGNELVDYVAEEQDADIRPELSEQIEDLDAYDIVFIGYPTWWYDMPQALYSFFDAYNFSGKTLVPFNVHNGSRFSGTIDTIIELEPDATVITDGFTVSERNVADCAKDVAQWLEGLGY